MPLNGGRIPDDVTLKERVGLGAQPADGSAADRDELKADSDAEKQKAARKWNVKRARRPALQEHDEAGGSTSSVQGEIGPWVHGSECQCSPGRQGEQRDRAPGHLDGLDRLE